MHVSMFVRMFNVCKYVCMYVCILEWVMIHKGIGSIKVGQYVCMHVLRIYELSTNETL